MKVLHVLYTYLPDFTGSSIRSSGLLTGQASCGISPVAITSPFQPGFKNLAREAVDGVTVYRTYTPGNPTISEKGASLTERVRKVRQFSKFVADITRVAKEHQVQIIHAHSTFYCGLAAWVASRRLGIPYVYEVRSLWESRTKDLGLSYRIQAVAARQLENLAVRLADRVVTISEGLRTELIERGPIKSRIEVVPNAVDDRLLELGSTVPPPDRIRRFGYIGNLSQIEGLDLLVEAFCTAFPSAPDAKLVFYGKGPYEDQLTELIRNKKDSRIEFKGSFARKDIAAAYRDIDCICIPRLDLPINQTVTPLKPLEAMAFSRAVCLSDVKGLIEVAGNQSQAFFFPAGDKLALANLLQELYRSDEIARTASQAGRNFVSRKRSWSSIAKTYEQIYKSL